MKISQLVGPGIAYVVVAFLIRRLYFLLERMHISQEGSGSVWWFAIGLYFVADLAALLAIIGFWRKEAEEAGWRQSIPFWYAVSELLPLMYFAHLTFFLWEYRISERLEGAGLGLLEVIVPCGFVIALVGACIRIVDKRKQAGRDQHFLSPEESR